MAKILTKIDLHRLSADGQLLEKRTFLSRSWLQHFFDLWYEPLGYQVNTVAANDIGSVSRNLLVKVGGGNTNPLCNLMVASSPGGALSAALLSPAASIPTIPAAGDDIGIVVGSGNTPVTPQDDALVTKVVHGSAAGELEYGGCEVLPPTFADPNGAMLIRRYFTNVSGGNVTIEEVGIYSPGYCHITILYFFCICRDVVAPAVVVADTELLMATYTVQITV